MLYRVLVTVICAALARGVVLVFGLDVAAADLIRSTITYFPPPEAISWIIAGLVGLIGLVLWVSLRMDERLRNFWRGPFRAEVSPCLVIEGRGPISMFMAVRRGKSGPTASPIGFLLNIKVANHQDSAIKIQSFSVAGARGRWGPWTPLSSIDLNSNRVFTLTKAGIRGAARLEFERLDVALQKQIEAHNSVAGWAAFERVDMREAGSPEFYKVTLQDSDGNTTTTTSRPATLQGQTEVGMASFRLLPGPVDLSSAVSAKS